MATRAHRMTDEPTPPPGLVDRLNRISDVEYALDNTLRKQLVRQRATVRRKMTYIERQGARLWAEYKELGELLEAINGRLADTPPPELGDVT